MLRQGFAYPFDLLFSEGGLHSLQLDAQYGGSTLLRFYSHLAIVHVQDGSYNLGNSLVVRLFTLVVVVQINTELNFNSRVDVVALVVIIV
jgi:hypothetical protein